MIGRRIYLFPLLAVILAGLALALLLGKRMASTTETEVIDRVAAAYVAAGGPAADRTDCAARPAQSDDLWLVVACQPAEGAEIVYFIDRFGRVAYTQPEA